MHGVGCWDSQLMQALLLPYPGCPVGTMAWLPTSALSFLFQGLKAWLKYLDLIFVFSGGPMAGEAGTLEKKWLHCQHSEPITSQQGQCSALKKSQQKLFLQINQL